MCAQRLPMLRDAAKSVKGRGSGLLRTPNLTLLGQYLAGNFRLSSDGHGGTMITDPPERF
jgi:hypothetical protein